METPIKGSVELLTRQGQSIGVAGTRWTVDAVPVVLETLYGMTGLAATEPTERAGALPVAEWEGVDAQNQPVTAVLWQETEFTATEIGQAMAAALVAQEG